MTARSCRPKSMNGVDLKEHFETLVDAERERVDLRFTAADEALELASRALTIRLDHSNGLIAAMKEQGAEFARRIELGSLEKRVDGLERMRSNVEGRKEGGQPLREIGILIVGAIIAYIAAKLST